MSYSEIYKFNKKGKAKRLGEVHNSWNGAMAIWVILEKKYLSTLPLPHYLNGITDYYSRTSFGIIGEKGMKGIWDLFEDKRLSLDEKIVLGSTYDDCIILRKNFAKTINAFKNFTGITNLKEQSVIIEEALKNKNIIAIAFNPTSVNGDSWHNKRQSKKGRYKPYNILKEDNHWELFKTIEENGKNNSE